MKKILIMAIALLSLVGCSNGDNGAKGGHIKLADAGWDSIRFHNAVVGFIAETAYDMTWEEVPGSTPITYEGLKKGEIDLYTEIWIDNLPTYAEDVRDGKLLELGTNFNDNYQGFYVPTYVIKGDASRGIEAMAPDLKTVEDLKKYADVFVDEDDPSKGRVYGAIPGWEVDNVMRNKWIYTGLDKTFNYFSPGSDAALSAAFTAAYEKGQPIVGYYWEPTWLMGLYDFTLLQDKPYVDLISLEEGKTELPPTNVTIVARTGFDTDFPEFTNFMKKYHSSSALTSSALAYMQENNAGYEEAAIWYIEANADLIGDMMPVDKWAKIEKILD